MGGLNQGGSEVLLMRQGTIQRATIGGYFQLRLSSPYSVPLFNPRDYLTKPHEYNQYIQDNIDLLCGDAMLELQSNAISTLANNQIPGTNTWVAIINWLNDFIQPIEKDYDMVFLDANPSFSMYTQIAIATSTKMVLPVMADDSSRRAIQNAFSLVYGLKLPSEIYSKYAFAIDKDVLSLLKTYTDMFAFKTLDMGIIDVRDFQTTGVVSAARGCPLRKLKSGRLGLMGKRVTVREEYRQNCIDNVETIVTRMSKEL